MTLPKNILLANFGGPRHLGEIPSFLTALLTDKEVIRSPFPNLIHRLFFSYVARKRARSIAEDYEQIGGRSPIYEDTEELARQLGSRLGCRTFTFHRYLPATHGAFVKNFPDEETLIFPLFPQFSYATTGSIALFFSKSLPPKVLQRLRWIPSYCLHNAYITAFQTHIRSFLQAHLIPEEEAFLLFSAHGLPQAFIDTGDIYETECQGSYQRIRRAFPEAGAELCYQSKFGKGEWLKPYTLDFCKTIKERIGEKKQVIFIPLSFTSDHIETLFEIECQYLPLVKDLGIDAYRCPALNIADHWLDAITQIIQDGPYLNNDALLRRRKFL